MAGPSFAEARPNAAHIKEKESEMFHCKVIQARKAMLLAGVLAGSILAYVAQGQTVASSVAANASSAQPAPPQAPGVQSAPYRFHQNRPPKRADMYYRSFWGVDSLVVKYAESGELIRFSWRVLDAERARPLNDKNVDPSLIDPQAGVKLVVPSLEKVGQLRQSSTPIPGKTYWMAFSNKGRLVKRGDSVTVVIGPFHAAGLVVE